MNTAASTAAAMRSSREQMASTFVRIASRPTLIGWTSTQDTSLTTHNRSATYDYLRCSRMDCRTNAGLYNTEDEMKKGAVVQITDKSNRWFPCLAIVEEVKNWGVQGYVLVPRNNGISQLYLRIGKEHYQEVGTAVITAEDK